MSIFMAGAQNPGVTKQLIGGFGVGSAKACPLFLPIQ